MTHFSVNVLTEDQLHISHRFARSGAENKWTGIVYTRGEHGVPIIQDSLVSFESAVESRVEAGDHTIIIGRVLKLHGPANAEPLLFYASAYRKIGQVEGHAAGDLVLLSWGL
jgi:flavin reductase (DIM6/NTAB) family NADH-FMN oxidoreductase RutF